MPMAGQVKILSENLRFAGLEVSNPKFGKSGRIGEKLASPAERCHQFANVQGWAKMHVSRTESHP